MTEVVVKRGRGRPRKNPVDPVKFDTIPENVVVTDLSDKLDDLLTPVLKVFKTHQNHELPTFATLKAACFDLKAQFIGKSVYNGYTKDNNEFRRSLQHGKIRVMPGDRVLVPTGLIFNIPDGYSVRVHARSGLSLKKGLVLANSEGVVDSDYVEEGFIMITNISNTPLDIDHGERIAQAEMVPVLKYKIEQTNEAPQKKGDRNGGFGSTGTN